MPEEITLKRGDTRIAVESWGSADDPVVLLIAGTSCTRDWWPPALCERVTRLGARVVRFDQRDTGASTTWPVGAPGYGLTELRDDVLGILDLLTVRRAHVVGFSQGGWVAQLLALDHPERVASLTLIATRPTGHGPADPDLPEVSTPLLTAWSALPEVDWHDSASVVRSYIDGERVLAGSVFDESHAARICTAAVRRSPHPESASNHPLITGPRWRERLPQIVAPTVVLHGTRDPLFPIENARALASEIPGATLRELPGVGHELPPRIWPALEQVLAAHLVGNATARSRPRT